MSKRRTGRTTRMLARAEHLAKLGRAVYVVFHDMVDAKSHETEERQALGIKFETFDSLPGLDFGTLKLRGAHRNCVVLIDHFAIEYHFAAILHAAVRFDQDHTHLACGMISEGEV